MMTNLWLGYGTNAFDDGCVEAQATTIVDLIFRDRSAYIMSFMYKSLIWKPSLAVGIVSI